MRILIISNLFPPHYLGGYELLCKGVCDELVKRGHEVTVLTSNHCSSTDPDSTVETDSFPYPVYRNLHLYLPFSQPAAICRFKRYVTGRHNYNVTTDIIGRMSPDIIFVWSQLRLTTGAAHCATDSGLPVVYTYNDDHIAGYKAPDFEFSVRGVYRYIADRLIFPKNTVVGLSLSDSTVISRSTKEEIIAKGVDITGAEVIYQGIPIERFPVKENPGTISPTVKLLYAGQLHHYKGVHTILEALGKIRKAREFDFHLTIAGDGPEDYKGKLRELANINGLEAYVKFAGKVPRNQMAQLYRHGEIFIFPSIWKEPFGLTHLEAMASGTPVISTTRGGPGEFLKDEENALTFEAENHVELAAKLARLVQDNNLRRQIAIGGRRTVEEGFTMTTYVDSLERFLTKHVRRELTGKVMSSSAHVQVPVNG